MPSRRKLISARRNGANGGPKTPEGKQRSSLNAITHGFCTNLVRLPTEDPEEFERHRQSFLQQFPSCTGLSAVLLNQLINISWRLQRAWALETTAITEAMEDELPLLEEKYEEYSEDVRLYTAHRAMVEKSNYLPFLNRMESRFSRELRQTLKMLDTINKKSQNGPNYPQKGGQ